MKLFFKTKENGDKGFTVLFSVIVSSIVLAIGVSIANITLKQILISSAGRESQIAFYAADSGAECAMYYDLVNGIFSASSSQTSDISCFGTIADELDFTGAGQFATSSFTAHFKDSNYCAKVKVGKYDDDGDGLVDKTIIDSRGYNICPDGTTNPRTLERGLQINY